MTAIGAHFHVLIFLVVWRFWVINFLVCFGVSHLLFSQVCCYQFTLFGLVYFIFVDDNFSQLPAWVHEYIRSYYTILHVLISFICLFLFQHWRLFLYLYLRLQVCFFDHLYRPFFHHHRRLLRHHLQFRDFRNLVRFSSTTFNLILAT